MNLKEMSKKQLAILIGAAVAVIAAVVLLIVLLPGGGQPGADPSGQTPTESRPDDAQPQVTATAATETSTDSQPDEAQPEATAIPAVAAGSSAVNTDVESFRTVGSYVTFGHYEQDNDQSNGQEPIEWLVLDYDAANNRALLISRHGLDVKPYNNEETSVTWEDCTLRAWLNDEFLNAAFTAGEQSAILLTDVDNGSSQGYSEWYADGGNNTQDKVFLLSYAEANRYFGVQNPGAPGSQQNSRSLVAPTDFARIEQGASTSEYFGRTDDGAVPGNWQLRSRAATSNTVAFVGNDGALGSNHVNYSRYLVRPALWIDLNAGIF